MFRDLVTQKLEGRKSEGQTNLEGRNIRRYEGKLFSVNSLSSNPPTLLTSTNHSVWNASLIPPYVLTCGEKAVSQVVYSNVIAHLLRNLECVIKRSRNMCAMTVINIQSLVFLGDDVIIWHVFIQILRYYGTKSVESIEKILRLLRHPELVSGSRYTKIRGQEVRRSDNLDGKKIRRYESKLFSVNSLSSNPPTLLPSTNHSGGNASLIPPYGLKKRTAFTLAEGTTHVAHFNNIRKAAFTLAEVLITLGIIGIVAALTMPALIANYKNKVFATQTKKTYSTILNAMNRWQYEAGASDYAGIFIQTKTTEELANEFFSYLNIAQICKSGSSDCAPEYYKYPKAKNDGKGKNATYSNKYHYKAVLADGSIISINPYIGGDSECGRIFTNKVTDADGNWIPDGNGGYETTEKYSKQCGVMMIDANGLKGPNQLGADAYSFIITNNKISNWHTKIESVLTDEELNYINYDAAGDFIN